MHQDLSCRLSFSHAPYGLFRVGTADISSVRGVGNHGAYFNFSTIHSRGDPDLEADLTCQMVSFRSEVSTQKRASRVLLGGVISKLVTLQPSFLL